MAAFITGAQCTAYAPFALRPAALRPNASTVRAQPARSQASVAHMSLRMRPQRVARRGMSCRASIVEDSIEDGDAPQDWAEVAKKMQADAQQRMKEAGEKIANGHKQQLEYIGPEQRVRQMEVDAAGDNEPLPHTLELFSPSKINVFLRIIKRRDDGFHDLASLFHVIDFGDQMKISKAPTDADCLTTDHPDVPLDDTNLINRAFKLFREKTGSNQYFWVHLKKSVPAGAGLGGGSGNAATALWAANEMCGTKIDDKTLMEWSGDLGSDCPIFFSHGAAYCTGRGEIVEELEPMLSLHTPMLLVKPNLFCSTPAIFKALDLESRSNADPVELLKRLTEEGINKELTVNDLEQPAFANMPELKMLKQRLTIEGKNKYDSVWMSGSGSTIVCWGSLDAPTFLYEEDDYEDAIIQPARLLTRQPGQWYQPHQTSDSMFGMGDEEAYGEGMTGREWLDKAGFTEEK